MAFGIGLAGQYAVENKPIVVDAVLANYLAIKSCLGTGSLGILVRQCHVGSSALATCGSSCSTLFASIQQAAAGGIVDVFWLNESPPELNLLLSRMAAQGPREDAIWRPRCCPNCLKGPSLTRALLQ